MQGANSGQSFLYGGQLPTPLQVRAVDQYGNPAPGAAVTWTTVAGGGTVTPIDAATDANGVARANYRLGPVPGANRIQASIAARSLTTELTASGLAIAQFSLGYEHTCALDENGAAYCWGNNDSGQLGFNSTSNRNSPTLVAGNLRFRRISVGNAVTCALTMDNTPYCWGSNSYAALGDGTTTYRLVPTPVSGGFHFTQISTGGQTTCALDAGGAAYCWGENGAGKLGLGAGTPPDICPSIGNGDFACSKAPIAVTGGLAFASLSTSSVHSCGLVANGDVYCWGFSYNFGGTGGGIDAAPVLVSNSLVFSSISASDDHTCGLVAPNSAYCWGNETQWGMIGNGFINQTEVKPVLLTGLTAQQVEARVIGSCALTTDGHGLCWGFNDTGGVGDGTTALRTTPTAISTSLLFTAIHTSGRAACGLIANGQLYCWGDNFWGQLGVGDSGSHLTPTLVQP
jgi:alpha-tubulin suppressor-like RCC1 family protein